jgi:small-conductance mechanosensitive channel
VIEIDLRSTTLQGDGQTVLIPNSMLFTNPITRFEDEQPQAQA